MSGARLPYGLTTTTEESAVAERPDLFAKGAPIAEGLMAIDVKAARSIRPDLFLRKDLNPSRRIESIDCPTLPDHRCAIWAEEEQLIPKWHPAADFIARTYLYTGSDTLEALKNDPSVLFGVPILEVEDATGKVLRSMRVEARVFHKDCQEEVPPRTMLLIPELALLRYVKGSAALEAGNTQLAFQLSKPDRGVLERNVFLQARAGVETAEALQAFDVLFRHYSLNEELWRLDEWMHRFLPFDLEEHPGMARYKALMETQIGHLRRGARHHYETDTRDCPINVEEYISKIVPSNSLMPLRLRWLMLACRDAGHKKVAEYGAIEGVSLFYLLKHCEEIEWHGFEANPAIAEKGRALAREAGITSGFNLHSMERSVLKPFLGTFDAVALFEALEHNNESDAVALLKDAEALCRTGGHIFITTPCGNWSAWDDRTRIIELQKDHVNVFTVARMERFLERYARMEPGSLKVAKVDNVASLHENNAWTFSRYILR